MTKAILALAVKDLRVLSRVRAAMFFTFGWPVVVAVLFGYVFSGGAQGTPQSALRLLVIDEDQTDASRAFIERAHRFDELDFEPSTREAAEAAVRQGTRPAFVVVKAGFGEAARTTFPGPPRPIELGIDPARKAEAAMIQGLLTKAAVGDMLERAGMAAWSPLSIAETPVARERRGPVNAFAITFPQGIMWGIIGCVMTFAVGLVSERVHGTFVRLQMAPVTRTAIMAGKALACFGAIAVVELVLLTLGVLVFGIRPQSYALLAAAGAAAAVAFVGFMMLIAGMGRTEQGTSGAGWAMLMPMTLFGGGMMPQFVMPSWMLTVGHLSPVKWTILGFEGAIWRGFSAGEMLLPCAVLVAFGAACFAGGVRALRD
ncbi:MAG: ABC transporter permease [Acidobacteriota bacterium]